MRTLKFLWLWVVSVVASEASAQYLTFTGYARDPQTEALMYVESHYVQRAGAANERRVVLYRCAGSDAVFARKQLDYSAQRVAPDFRFEDARLGYVEGLRRSGTNTEVFLREQGAAPERSGRLPRGKTIVADAGFDEFVRENWSRLEAGETLRFSFLVPSRLDHLGFKIRKIRETRIEGETASVIQLNLSGVFGWFLPNIEVSYRQRDRVLMRYAGVVNVRDLESRNIIARIDFPAAQRRVSGPQDFAALLAQPLVSVCPTN